MTVFSGSGFLFTDVSYPDPGLLEQYLANDPVNIMLGLPLSIAASGFNEKGKAGGCPAALGRSGLRNL